MLQKKQTSIQVIQITYRNSADSFYVWESVSGITVRKIFIPNFFILVFPALIMYPRTSLNFQSETSGAMGTSEFLRQGAWAVTWWTRQEWTVRTHSSISPGAGHWGSPSLREFPGARLRCNQAVVLRMGPNGCGPGWGRAGLWGPRAQPYWSLHKLDEICLIMLLVILVTSKRKMGKIIPILVISLLLQKYVELKNLRWIARMICTMKTVPQFREN